MRLPRVTRLGEGARQVSRSAYYEWKAHEGPSETELEDAGELHKVLDLPLFVA